MDVFRIEQSDGVWTLLKAHGYRILLTAENPAALVEHVLQQTGGAGAVVRFDSARGVRELRIGAFSCQQQDAENLLYRQSPLEK